MNLHTFIGFGSKEEDDRKWIKNTYPHLVTITQAKHFSAEVGEWWKNCGFDNMIVVENSPVEYPFDLPRKITFGFKNKDDALAFRLTFQ